MVDIQAGLKGLTDTGRARSVQPLARLAALLLLALAMLPQASRAVTLELQPGLNLLAYPAPSDPPLDCNALLAELGGSAMGRLDPLSQRFQDCAAEPFVIAPREGYQLWMPSLLFLDRAATGDCPRYDFGIGLNLIALPRPAADLGCHQLLQAIGDPTEVSAVQRFDSVAGRFETCHYAVTGSGSTPTPTGTDFPIVASEAYLVDARQALIGRDLNDPGLCINHPPTIGSTPASDGTIDQDYQYQVLAEDPDGDALDYRLSQAPLGMTIGPDGLLRWLPVAGGDFAVTLTVDDGRGTPAQQSFLLTVVPGDGTHPPVLDAIGNQTAALGATLSLQLSATDPDGDPLSFSVQDSPLPPGMSLEAATGRFRFTPGLDQVGEHSLRFVVDDGRFNDAETLTITVPPPGGITRVYGRVVNGNVGPLANVRLESGGVETLTDADGRFLLDDLPQAGRVRLLVDGSTVDPALGVFATVPEIIDLIPGADNQLDPDIVLLPLDVASADPVDPTTTSRIISSRVVDGLTISAPVTLTIPPGRAIDDATGEPFVGDIHISRVPDPTMGPRPLPADIDLSFYIAIQPFGVSYPEPVPISFPNLEGFAPGSRLDFFALNHATGEFEKIGEGLVSGDGKTVDSIGGIVKANSWHGIVPQAPIAAVDGDPKLNEPAPYDEGAPDDKPPCCAPCESGGCTMDRETGNLSEYHILPTYASLGEARVVKLEYNSNTAHPAPIVPVISGFGNAAPPPDTMSMRIEVGGVLLGEEKFTEVRVEPSGIRGQFKTTRPAIQFDATRLTTGLHDYDLVVDCHFPISRRSETITGQVMINNRSASPFGAGWSFAALQRLYIHADGGVMLSSGGAADLLFTPNTAASDYDAPAGEYSSLRRLADGRFLRRMRSGIEYLFASDGRLARKTDRNGNATDYQYDADGLLTAVVDPVGKAYRFEWFAGRIAAIVDPLGRRSRFTHDSEGNLIAITEPNGDTRRFEYQPGSHLMTVQVDQRGNRTEYTYDFAGRIAGALLPDGSETRLEVAVVKGLIDPATGPATRDDPAPAPLLEEEVDNAYIDHNGNRSIAESDDRNRPLRQTDAVGRVTAFERDADSNATGITRPNGSQIAQVFDQRGKRLQRREAFNTATRSTSYDDHGLLTSTTNPRNHQTTITRDNDGNATRIVNHLGHTSTIDYDDRGLVTRQETPNGLVTRYSYNAQGLVATITETPPAGSPGSQRLTEFSYDAAGQVTRLVTPDDIVIDLVYDPKGRLTRAEDNLGQVLSYVYDAHDNLIRSDTRNSGGDLALTLASRFDARNRALDDRAPHNDDEDSVVQRILDNNSNPTGQIDPNGHASRSQFDGEDRLVEHTHRLDGITEYDYDSNDRITRITAPNGVVTEYTYDVLGRRLTETSPDRGTLSYEYDLADNITSITDARGITTTFTYDELERVTSKTFPNTIPGKDESVTYRYDDCPFGIGRLCGRDDESGSYAYEYDAFGNVVRIIRSELGVSYTTRYVYDDGDNMIQTTYPSGRVIDYFRDGLRRVEAIDATVNGAAKTIVDDIHYRADDQMIACRFGNGLIDQRAYDLQGRLTRQRLSDTAGQTVDQRSYAYDPNGNILQRDTTPQTSDYRYDALDRLIGDAIDGADPFDYQYDLNHNRLSRTQGAGVTGRYDYQPGSNRLLRVFDVTTEAPQTTAENREFRYNDANRLYQVIDDGELKAEYIYNGAGQRTRKTLYEAGGSSETILYHYDGMGRLIGESDPLGVFQRDYLWAEDGSPLAQIDWDGSAERLTYLHTDHLLTGRLGTDDGGAVVWRWDGEAFGNTPPDEIVDVVVNLRFPGQYFDGEAGQNYNVFRYYNPETSRYMKPDPIGLAAGINTYSYANSNAVVNGDPVGLSTLQIGLSGTGGAGAGGTGGAGIVVGFSLSHGFQLGRYGVVGVGGYAGAGGSIALDFTGSNNRDINHLSGIAGTTNVSGGEFIVGGAEINIPKGPSKPSYTVSAGIGGGTPYSHSAFVTNTNVKEALRIDAPNWIRNLGKRKQDKMGITKPKASKSLLPRQAEPVPCP